MSFDTPDIRTLCDLFGVDLIRDVGAPSPVLRSLAAKRRSPLSAHVMPRLLRIGRSYRNNTNQIEKLQKTIKNLLSERNWIGAYAELCALDFFCHRSYPRTLGHINPPLISHSIRPKDKDVTVRTYAEELGGKSEINVDLYWDFYNVYSDIKVLKCNVTEVLNSVYRKIWRSGRMPMIACDFPSDGPVRLLANNKGTIVEALKRAAATRERLVTVRMPPLGDVRFTLKWTAGVQISEFSTDPYRQAAERYRDVFSFVNKFVVDAGFFLTFVRSDLFSPDFVNFDEDIRIFYRAFARRVFLQHRHSTFRFSDVNQDFLGRQTVSEVLRSIAGLLFLDDGYISTKKRRTNKDWSDVTGYLYLNPNAGEPHPLLLLLDRFNWEIDDFGHDNY